jgi:hypothetical protein
MGLTLLLLVQSACSQDGAPVARSTPLNVPFVPDISINEIMVGQVDHAASYILALVAEEAAPSGEEPWQEAEHNAIQLVSSTSAISMGGSGNNDAMWVVQSGWRQHTASLNDASVAALQASRKRDMAALRLATQQLSAACDACHAQYKPDTPTQGFYRRH